MLQSHLKLHHDLSTSCESDSGSQTSNLVLVLCDDIGENSVLSWRDLLGKVNIFRQRHATLLKRATEVDILDGVAKIGRLSDDRDKAVLDLQVDLGALLNVVGEVTFGSNAQSSAAVRVISHPQMVWKALGCRLTLWVGLVTGRRS